MLGMPGAYKNYDELEEALCLAELEHLLEGIKDNQWREWQFAAAMQGVDLDGQSGKSTEERLQEVHNKAAARLNNVSEEEYEMADIGIEFTVEDDE